MMFFRLLVIVVVICSLGMQQRPSSLDIVADCGAIPDDGLDDTAEIRACLLLAPREIVIPLGVFDVDRTSNEGAILDIAMSDTVFRGGGSGSELRLIRDANGISQARILGVRTVHGVDVERVTIRDLTLNGGRGDLTCVETKHGPNGEQGQQQHGLFVSGFGDAYVRDVVIERVNFVGHSGDAVFIYQNVEGFRLEKQTIGGWCRAGIVLNAYSDCDAHLDESLWDAQQQKWLAMGVITETTPWSSDAPVWGMRNIVVEGNTFRADDTAQESARAIDVEPNAYLCDVVIRNNTLDQIEVGQTRRLVIEGNNLTTIGNQAGGSLHLVSIRGGLVEGNRVDNRNPDAPGLWIRKSHDVGARNNHVVSYANERAIDVSNNGNLYSKNITLDGNTVEYKGPAPSTKFAIYTQFVKGFLDVTDNIFPVGWKYGVHFFGGGDIRATGNVWDVEVTALHFRTDAVSEIRTTKSVFVDANRGTAARVYGVYGALSGPLRDCGGTSTGIRGSGGNQFASCSIAEDIQSARNDDVEARLQALEAAP